MSIEQQESHPANSDIFSQKPRKNVCPYCNISCTKPSVLDKHIRTHTNERPFPCTPCKIAFKTQSNLYKHCRSRTHSLKVESNIDSSSADIVAELGESFREELVSNSSERISSSSQGIILNNSPHHPVAGHPQNLSGSQQTSGQNLAIFHHSAQQQQQQNQRLLPPTIQEQNQRILPPSVQDRLVQEQNHRRENLSVPLVQIEKPEQLHQSKSMIIIRIGNAEFCFLNDGNLQQKRFQFSLNINNVTVEILHVLLSKTIP